MTFLLPNQQFPVCTKSKGGITVYIVDWFVAATLVQHFLPLELPSCKRKRCLCRSCLATTLRTAWRLTGASVLYPVSRVVFSRWREFSSDVNNVAISTVKSSCVHLSTLCTTLTVCVAVKCKSRTSKPYPKCCKQIDLNPSLVSIAVDGKTLKQVTNLWSSRT